MQAYLFVHFKEKTTPDGEQVYFGLSRDGFHWEKVNGGKPVLWAYYGDRGVRDFTIIRAREDGRFYILATDLSLAYGMRNQYHGSWEEIGRNGSKYLAMWESDDLVNWSEQRLVRIGDENFGCVWAPDIIYDERNREYILHWSSSHRCNDYGNKAIYCSRTRDFAQFSKPELLYRGDDDDVIDSAIYEEDGRYYMFVKSQKIQQRVILLEAEDVTGPYRKMDAFEESTKELEAGVYEAPTAVRLEDGRWCLFLDYYGKPGAAQGYVPFVADSLKSGKFVRSDSEFSFPYGYKHGTILTITMEEYERIKSHNWSDNGYV
ncbi:MAG: glycoside hydrolase family 43 protein [Lachnospiraceae bacterium]|nr:glycoside hydrolase family 43 protein [Lachnospiraceae bacterium]